MKLAELIQEYETSLSENAEAALRSADWNYDVDPFETKRFTRGKIAMQQIKESLQALHSRSPEQATALWQKHCPYARGVLPAWILE